MPNQTFTTAELQQIAKVSSGITNLDEVLHGGFPEKRTTLIKGAAGTGKTVLGLEFLHHSAINGEPVIFISFEETAQALRQNALSMGWDLAPLEAAGRFFLWEAKLDRTTITSGDFGLDSLLSVIQGKAEEMGARRIMIDAIDVLMRIFEDTNREHDELYRLHDWLIEQQFTTLLTAKALRPVDQGCIYEFLDYMADCVLVLDLQVTGQVTTRRLRVVKYRGSGFYSNEYPYLITSEGNIILPITGVQLVHQPPGQKISSGNAEFDRALGGGFHRAATIVISGPSGSGKTTLAATFTEAACAKGDKVLYISFEESSEMIVTAMRSPGIDLRPALEQGSLHFYTILPETLPPEEHLYRILRQLDDSRPDHLVLDAISACNRMGTEAAAFDFLVRLIHTCKERQITCLMTNQMAADKSQLMPVNLGIASIVDTLISLRFIEVDHRIKRNLLVVKSRGAHHSNRHHVYAVTNAGIRLEPLADEAGGS